ncbi:phage tail protein I [Aeromonas aquatica]|uniref:phage tail protein I n=1 Tax=Aeromonas aquatica TaxID=558964 RepID=UPI001376EC5E|nr:phage tail protein I [Aeromonas aquatica]
MPPLLPRSSSVLEWELDKALSHIESVEIPISTLWDPWRCPEVALPYLAWAMNTDTWDHSWSEKVKRQVIAGALDLHRGKGTRASVEQALESLDVKCDLREWFEPGGEDLEPGMFLVTAFVSVDYTKGVDSAITRHIREAVDAARPYSRPFLLSVQGMLRAEFGVYAALRMTAVTVLKFET